MQTAQVQCRDEQSVLSPGIVHIVDDDDRLREALVRLVRSAGLDALGHSNAVDLRNALGSNAPTCIVLDMRLKDETGLAVQDTLRRDGNAAPIIFLTGFGTIPMTVEAMRGGATEFLTKPVDDCVLLGAIDRALEHDRANGIARRSKSDLQLRHATLTDREREVMTLVIGGLMNKQIAGELGITEITAKVHKRHVMEKMCARSLPDLVRIAEALGVPASRTR